MISSLNLFPILGEGKYEGKIGALILIDSEDREVRVGSGLSDEQRSKTKMHYYGQVIEIEYERIDSTYIQPIFKCIRDDKEPGEID